MPSFVHAPLLWGMLLLGIPLLIHLINLLRQRRVEWAAMEFLLESQKKNRRWIVLREMLLLLMRLAAVAAVVLILAQPMLHDGWAAVLGGSKTHHIVLLDDSFSMTDRRGDGDAFERAKRAISQLGQDLSARGVPQSFTLLRFSRAADDEAQPDLLEQLVSGSFPSLLDDTLAELAPSQTAVGPRAAIESLDRLLPDEAVESRAIYLVSDFRANQWAAPEELNRLLHDYSSDGTLLHFIDCVEAARPNLAISELAPRPGTRAAGVPLFMQVSVTNYGSDPARNVTVAIEENGAARPGVVIEELAAGATETRRFLVQFPTAGQHVVTARLESDAIEADNERLCVVDLPLSEQVLLVDGDEVAADARFLATALAPGGTVRTGITTRIEPPTFLNTHPLAEFRTIYLTNVGSLGQSAIEALEQYVAAGGGVAIFVGEATQTHWLNERLYRQGEGLFPLPVVGAVTLPVDRLQKAPDLDVTDHPMFKVFAGQRNSFLSSVNVERYLAASQRWQPPTDESIRVIARLRNGSPLAVERRLGDGRVVAILTTASPTWNNWGRNPSYVVAMLELQAYLAERPETPSLVVGSDWQLSLDAALYDPDVRFQLPAASGLADVQVDAVRSEGRLNATLTQTAERGLYEAHLGRADGDTEVRAMAVNVSPDEGNLATVGGEQLAAALSDVRFEYHRADDVRFTNRELSGFNLSEGLLYLLVVLLLGEQALAYFASYHPRRASGGARP